MALVVGIILDAATATKLSACSSDPRGTPTLLGIPGTPAPTGCDGANVIAGIGLVLIVAGIVVLVIGLVRALRRG